MRRPYFFFVLTAVIAVGGTVCDEELPFSRDHELSYCRDVVSTIDLLANDGHTKVSNVSREEASEQQTDVTVTCMERHPVPLPASAAAATTTATSTANELRLSLQARLSSLQARPFSLQTRWSSLQFKSPSLATLACLAPAGSDPRVQRPSGTLDTRRSVRLCDSHN
jgi:hypothetical protein